MFLSQEAQYVSLSLELFFVRKECVLPVLRWYMNFSFTTLDTGGDQLWLGHLAWGESQKTWLRKCSCSPKIRGCEFKAVLKVSFPDSSVKSFPFSATFIHFLMRNACSQEKLQIKWSGIWHRSLLCDVQRNMHGSCNARLMHWNHTEWTLGFCANTPPRNLQ